MRNATGGLLAVSRKFRGSLAAERGTVVVQADGGWMNLGLVLGFECRSGCQKFNRNHKYPFRGAQIIKVGVAGRQWNWMKVCLKGRCWRKQLPIKTSSIIYVSALTST